MKKILLILGLGLFMVACSSDDSDCSSAGQHTAGCPSGSPYSCPSSNRCYSTRTACDASGDCG